MMIKKIFKVFLILFIFVMPFNLIEVHADEAVNEYSVSYQKFINPVFQANPNYRVLSNENIDVTSKFIDNTINDYREGDEKRIKEYLMLNDYVIERTSSQQTRDFSNSYYKEYFKTVTGHNTTGGSYTFEIDYAVIGRARADDSYYIVSYSDPTLNVVAGKPGWYMSAVSCGAKNKGSYIQVDFSFRANITFTQYDTDHRTFTTDRISGSFQYTPVY